MAQPVTDVVGRLAASVATSIADASARSGGHRAAIDDPTLRRTLAEAIAGDPALSHVVNAEPWYRSRVTWGAIIAALAPLIALVVGHRIEPADQSLMVDIAMAVGSIAGAALALHGRWIAKVPLGRKTLA